MHGCDISINFITDIDKMIIIEWNYLNEIDLTCFIIRTENYITRTIKVVFSNRLFSYFKIEST